MSKIIKPAIILLIICAITTAALAYVNMITIDPINEQIALKEANARRAVLPDAEEFSEVPNAADIIGSNPAFDMVKSAHYGLNGGEKIGICYLTKSKGYGGDITIMIGIDNDGTIKSINFGDNSETPGLGTKAGETPFISQFNAFDIKNGIVLVKGVHKNNNEIEAITGATITSRAVVAAVKASIALNNKLMEGRN